MTNENTGWKPGDNGYAADIQPTIKVDENDIVYRLNKRAEIRRQIPTRKSVQEGANDRIADLLEEAAREIMALRDANRKLMSEVVALEWDVNNERN